MSEPNCMCYAPPAQRHPQQGARGELRRGRLSACRGDADGGFVFILMRLRIRHPQRFCTIAERSARRVWLWFRWKAHLLRMQRATGLLVDASYIHPPRVTTPLCRRLHLWQNSPRDDTDAAECAASTWHYRVPNGRCYPGASRFIDCDHEPTGTPGEERSLDHTRWVAP
jgi:hypothetical protein